MTESETSSLSDLDKEFRSKTHIRCSTCYNLTELKGYAHFWMSCWFCKMGIMFKVENTGDVMKKTRMTDIAYLLAGQPQYVKKEEFVYEYIYIYVSPPVTRSSEPSHDGK